jgi:hypothetical protein
VRPNRDRDFGMQIVGRIMRVHTHTRARTHVKENPGKRSPCSPCSLNGLKSEGYEGEHRGGRQNAYSPCSPLPDWLRELDP